LSEILDIVTENQVKQNDTSLERKNTPTSFYLHLEYTTENMPAPDSQKPHGRTTYAP